MNERTAEKERTQYSYYAFVSYSRKDEKWAKWLQNKLETYRLPAAIRKNNIHVPPKISPIFRDKTDLSGTMLEDSLHRELDASQYLIVICSPNSAASPWVNNEIAHFIAAGRIQDIVPFIVDGVPHAPDPAKECFPPTLLETPQEHLGINVNELGKHRAFLRVVSTLLNLRHDQVVMRDKKRRNRNRLLSGAAALLGAIGLGTAIWYNMPHSKYYNAYTYQNEIPMGIYELSSDERESKHLSYRITTQRGKVVRLESVSSSGIPTESPINFATADYPVLDYLYDDDGKLITIEQRDNTNQLVSRKNLSYNDTGNQIAIDLRLPSNSIQVQAMAADVSYNAAGSDSIIKSEITRMLNTYDENGFLIKTEYHKDNLGNPACDNNGVYGKLYTYTKAGLMESISNLDASGQVHASRNGWATVVYTYDERGNTLSEHYLDAQGNRIANHQGVYEEIVTYDENGNSILWQGISESGQLCNSEDGYAYFTLSYHEDGKLESVYFYDASENPCYTTEKIHGYQYLYDENGRRSGSCFLGTDKQPIFSSTYACAGIRQVLDADGRLIEEWRLDTNGEPFCSPETGAYSMRYTYDENGFISEQWWLDQNGDPAMTLYGYAGTRRLNDSAGNLLEQTWLDEQGEPMRNRDNYATEKCLFDTFGNIISIRYYDEDGNPCLTSEGISGIDYTYENGNMTSLKNIGIGGTPVLSTELYCERRVDYDSRGNCIRWSYFDEQGSPMTVPGSYSSAEQTYDENGRVTDKRYYDTCGEPMSVDGLYRISWEYDEAGRTAREIWYFYPESAGQTMTIAFSYDENGREIRRDYLNADGTPIAYNGDPATFLYGYDPAGNPTLYAHLDAEGLPYSHADPAARNLHTLQYNELGQVVLEQFYHKDAAGVETCLVQYAYTYDAFGNEIRCDVLDSSGALWDGEEGYASCLREYTAVGNIAAEEYYDENGRPVEYGTAWRFEYTYSGSEEPVAVIRYGTDGNLQPQSSGVPAYTLLEYDALGNLVTWISRNESNEPFQYQSYPARIAYAFDTMGYQVRTDYFDADGELLSTEYPCMWIDSVTAGSNADYAGMEIADILISFNGWNFFEALESGDFHFALTRQIAQSTNGEKVLTLCRVPETGDLEIYTITLPAGEAGFSLTDLSVTDTDLDHLRTLYEDHS